MGKITPDQLFNAQCEQYSLDIVDFKTQSPPKSWAKYTSPQSALKEGRIVWRVTDHCLIFAITDPRVMDKTRTDFQHYGRPIEFVMIKRFDLHSFIQNTQDTELQKATLTTCPEHISCRSWTQNTISHIWGILTLTALGAIAYYAPIIFLYVTLSFVFTALILNIIFRIIRIITMQSNLPISIAPPNNRKLEKRPKVSILVPLYKETAIIKRLVTRLQALTCPTELLEICFIYEELDCETRMVLQSMKLPHHMRALQVPAGQLQTKPRAMNYALDFCSGDIIGIYDAEDAPEINQIEQVIQKFASADNEVACVQCILDF